MEQESIDQQNRIIQLRQRLENAEITIPEYEAELRREMSRERCPMCHQMCDTLTDHECIIEG